MRYKAAASASKFLWIVEYMRNPEDDEGMHTLFGPFENFNEAVLFGEAEFSKSSKQWHIRSIWPVVEQRKTTTNE